MTPSVLATLVATGLTVSFLHATIPTHWLPFVLTGQVQRWSRAKTLAVTAVCATGHVLGTAVLGGLVAWLGFTLSENVGVWFPRVAGGALILAGLFFVYRQWLGHGHSHLFGGLRHHEHGHGAECDADHDETPAPAPPPPRSDRAAIASLFTLLTFSPCEGFIPIYASGARYGWQGFAILTAILSVGAVAAMVLFTWLTQLGARRLKFRWLEHYESGVLGGLLCLLGVLVMVLEA